ncbi:hypothetical protein [Ornithinimicrobium tianjinense]|uniref:Phosphodiesterase n=1 Tax=Ornithinimicrobium tianjinense TaxID=1195761 RepID=A0A917BRW4_9MICO|nr:hypothetical protein [Ornithinimicrobium tianjinense]GGF53739.1 hypothetical protein GCM10011366_21970 [Ornithinimicrobium tianjinense]
MSLADVVGHAGGAVLAAVFGLIARLRGTRALHPVGVCGAARLDVRTGPPSGVPVLDGPGPHRGVARWSRATGRRGDGLDIEGLALRIDGPTGGDVLLASTGTGVVGRHVLVLRRRDTHGPLTTLLPLSTRRGRLLLRLDPVEADPVEADPRGWAAGAHPPTSYRLLVSAPGRPWHERGTLELTWTEGDCTRRHDPVGRPPAGTWVAPLWAALRDPSYAASEQVAADPVTPAG